MCISIFENELIPALLEVFGANETKNVFMHTKTTYIKQVAIAGSSDLELLTEKQFQIK